MPSINRQSILKALVAFPLALLGFKPSDPVLRFPRLKGRKELKKRLRTIKPSGTHYMVENVSPGIEPTCRDTLRMFGHDPDDVTPQEFLRALNGSGGSRPGPRVFREPSESVG